MKVVPDNIGLLGSPNTQEQTGIRFAQACKDRVPWVRSQPPQAPEVHFFIDQRFKTK